MNINNTMSTPFIKQLTYIYKLSLEAEYLIIKIIVARARSTDENIKHAYRDTINNRHVGKTRPEDGEDSG